MEQQPKCLLFKIVFAVLGVISGISIFVSFVHYKNWNAAIWGLLSGIFAIVVLRLHIFRRKNVMHLRYSAETLRMAKFCGAFTSVASIIAAITYFLLSWKLKQGYQIYNEGYAPAGTFSLMTLKWTFMLFWSGRSYEKYLRAFEESHTVTSNQPYKAYSNPT